MNRSSRVFDVLSVLAIGGVAALTAAVYPELPARMPIHFDLHGNPNGWMDRPLGAWLLVVLAAAMWAGFRFAPLWMPAGEWRERAERSPMGAAAFLYALLIAMMQPIVLWAALHRFESLGSVVMGAVAVYLLAYSSILPRVRRNPILGVKSVWALTSDENWHRTNRFASYCLGGAALVAAACAAVGTEASVVVFLVASVASAAAPHVYSYMLARRTSDG